MNSCGCNPICPPRTALRLLRGVERRITLTLYESDCIRPIDLSDATLLVVVSRDGSGWKFEPEFELWGAGSGSGSGSGGVVKNKVSFVWDAAHQPACGSYTIDIYADLGDRGNTRTNWHGPNGIELVEYAEMVCPRCVAQGSGEGA